MFDLGRRLDARPADDMIAPATPSYDIDDAPMKPRPELSSGWRALTEHIFGDNAELVKAWWKGKALCAETDPDMFFPEVGDHYSALKATLICQKCEIMDACLERAMTTPVELSGVWGGTTPMDRRQGRQWWNR